MITRADCVARDAADPLAPLRGLFDLDQADAHGTVYLDGNSLGALPRATAERVRQVIAEEWGVDLIRSWNNAGWIALSQHIADKIARLIGAAPGGVVVADSTSVNLYKTLSAAVETAQAGAAAADRVRIAFRTSHIADSVAQCAVCSVRGNGRSRPRLTTGSPSHYSHVSFGPADATWSRSRGLPIARAA